MARVFELWAVEASSLLPQSFANMLNALPLADRDAVTRFVFEKDRHRAVVSRCMQRALVRVCLIESDDAVELARTPQGKPYVTSPALVVPFNVNVSHHGSYVVGVAHNACLVGIDVVDLTTRTGAYTDFGSYLRCFQDYLTPAELCAILSQPTETDRYSYFYTLWALKESFVKAIGLGIGYPLAELHFDVVFDLQASPSAPLQAGSTTTPATVAVPHAPFRGSATVRIRGEERRDWSFELFSIGETHTVAVARGPFTDAIDHFASCLPLSSHKYDSTVVVEPLPPLRILTPDELLPTVPAHRFDQSLDDAQHSAAEHGLCKCTVA